uniref:Uncharacterized protein n=1 Tax=Periophthalmus magnuspinnatus TaxID=409849 RepID=A0A3B3ZHF4_9GOBI
METTLEPLDPALVNPVVRPDALDPCLDSRGRYKVVPSVVCSMCCLFGIIYCFFVLYFCGILMHLVNIQYFYVVLLYFSVYCCFKSTV